MIEVSTSIGESGTSLVGLESVVPSLRSKFIAGGGGCCNPLDGPLPGGCIAAPVPFMCPLGRAPLGQIVLTFGFGESDFVRLGNFTWHGTWSHCVP